MSELLRIVPAAMQSMSLALPIILITQAQVKAILRRDDRQCLFPEEHVCKRKMAVHHVNGKGDIPENLITVCRVAHWDYLHNKKCMGDWARWEEELSNIAETRTMRARKRGWNFPD